MEQLFASLACHFEMKMHPVVAEEASRIAI